MSTVDIKRLWYHWLSEMHMLCSQPKLPWLLYKSQHRIEFSYYLVIFVLLRVLVKVLKQNICGNEAKSIKYDIID